MSKSPASTPPAPQTTRLVSSSPFSKLPTPTRKDLNDPIFNAIWMQLKTWDINIPQYYYGYCSGNGSHVKLLLDTIKAVLLDMHIKY